MIVNSSYFKSSIVIKLHFLWYKIRFFKIKKKIFDKKLSSN